MKELVWSPATKSKLKSLDAKARQRLGWWLDDLQNGRRITSARASQRVEGEGYWELRLSANNTWWRIYFKEFDDFIGILDVHQKKTNKIPPIVKDRCRKRLQQLNEINNES